MTLITLETDVQYFLGGKNIVRLMAMLHVFIKIKDIFSVCLCRVDVMSTQYFPVVLKIF